MCKYCDAGAMLRSSGVELPGGLKAAMALWITWSKEGTPIIRAKIDYGTKDKNFRGCAASRIPACSVEIKYCPFCGKKLLKDPIFPQMAEESAIEIAKDPEHGPAILYWFKSESGYWAVDNRNHSAFSMCFLSKEECLAYLAANA